MYYRRYEKISPWAWGLTSRKTKKEEEEVNLSL
jgi:hypothetical protein